MLGNCGEFVRNHRVFVVDGGEEIIGVLVLIEEESGHFGHGLADTAQLTFKPDCLTGAGR